MAAGLEVTREDLNFVEEKIELLDVPEQDIKEGWVFGEAGRLLISDC